ncbi:DMT family transporter [Labrenzia sp. PHM005]|uniref:DMT family transporter n=1 Tax=Labrenzia sp. PHM005 TaxID=2590016 RepID=UPI0011407881|nr:DMT family transporter [Labrenzia sp. PHM005]QDG77949.1 DMT family transporter [Labrenzia sp. PHM005]
MSETAKTTVEGALSAAPHRGSLLTRLYDQPLFLLLIVGSFLALSMIFAKSGPIVGWHPLGLLQWSIIGGAGLLYFVTKLLGAESGRESRRERSAKIRLLTYISITGLLFIAPNMIAVMAAPKVGASFVSLTFAFPLVLTYAFAVLIGLERFKMLRSIGVLAGVVGGVLLAGGGAGVSAEASFWSVVTLAIPVFLAAGNIYRTLKWPDGATAIELALGMMVTAFLALAVFNAAMGIPVIPVDWTSAAASLLIANIGAFAVQYGLYFRLQQVAGPVYLSQIGSVAAVAGLGLGYLVFSEIPNAAKIGAIAAVALGIVFVALGKDRG